MTDLEVKAAVRERDGYKCTRCGKTNAEHIEETDRALDVHRVIPGIVYSVEWCVTLCRTCHGKMPKKFKDAYFFGPERSGILFLHYLLHDETEGKIYEYLKQMAEIANTNIHEIAQRIFLEAMAKPYLDYCI